MASMGLLKTAVKWLVVSYFPSGMMVPIWNFLDGRLKHQSGSCVRDQLQGVQRVQATHSAFAAILEDQTVVAWGDPSAGGDCT